MNFKNPKQRTVIILFFLISLWSCKKNEKNASISEDKQTVTQLQILESAGIDSFTTYNNVQFEDGTSIKAWGDTNDANYVVQFGRPSSITSTDDTRELFIKRMFQAGDELTNDALHTYPINGVNTQPNGLAYINSSKSFRNPFPVAGCPPPLYGLDCSGMIYQMALGSGIPLPEGGTVDYSKVTVWNNALAGSGDLTKVELTDTTNLSQSQLEAGDILVRAGNHIGMIYKNGSIKGFMASNGSPECTSVNKDSKHGPVKVPGADQWVDQYFSGTFHILRPRQNIKNTTWNLTLTYTHLNPPYNLSATMDFYADGTYKYDEPSTPGVYLKRGPWKLFGNKIYWDFGNGPTTGGGIGYKFNGTVTGKSASGTFYFNGRDMPWTMVQR